MNTENQLGTTCYISDALTGIEVSALLAHKVATSDKLTVDSINTTIDILRSEDAQTVNSFVDIASATGMVSEEEEEILIHNLQVIDDSLQTMEERLRNF